MKKPASRLDRKWQWHRRALQQIRDELLRERDEHASAIRSALDRGGEDDVDRANDKCERDTLLAEIQLEDAELAEVEAALRRIRDGTYGICELTGQPISPARLRAIPWTRLSRRGAMRVAQGVLR
ncbi:MAG TPA: TraR/DksA C4-type zinc finger protein [Opitutus sp.]|nr:TraR/DksA C4-type zinc finger protein [Opitutus sp.]